MRAGVYRVRGLLPQEAAVADLVTCIRTDPDCAEICDTTGRVLTPAAAPHRPGRSSRPALPRAPHAWEGCLRYAGTHEHCGVCAEACRRYEQACRNLLATLGRAGVATTRAEPAGRGSVLTAAARRPLFWALLRPARP